MANGYNRFQNQNLQKKNSFMPMLCSSRSIIDVVVLPKSSSESDQLPSTFCNNINYGDDPLSPKISCIGQVKKKKRNNNKLHITLPTSHTKFIHNNNNTNFNITKYHKLKKLFTAKNLAAGTAISAATTSKRCGSRRIQVMKKGCGENDEKCCCCCSKSIVDLDPPLPVIMKRLNNNKCGDGDQSLWKRRSGGVAVLQRLEINQNHDHLRLRLQPSTV